MHRRTGSGRVDKKRNLPRILDQCVFGASDLDYRSAICEARQSLFHQHRGKTDPHGQLYPTNAIDIEQIFKTASFLQPPSSLPSPNEQEKSTSAIDTIMPLGYHNHDVNNLISPTKTAYLPGRYAIGLS